MSVSEQTPELFLKSLIYVLNQLRFKRQIKLFLIHTF